MFEQISKSIKGPEWWRKDPRFWRLTRFDRLLHGTFYDCLEYSFYQEMTESTPARLIPLEQRRPSSPFNLPSKVSRGTSRKMFAGRHVPRVHHANKEIQRKLRRLVKRCDLYRNMLEVAFRGSVGSVAATFAVYGEKTNPNVQLTIWESKYCDPEFNESGDLKKLTVRYITSAAALKALGIAGLDEQDSYWFIKVFDDKGEYVVDPIRAGDWNPVDGFTSDDAEKKGFVPLADLTKAHTIGFVPAQWFRNLTGGEFPDGACTWKAAISTAIDMDYTMSQLGRGVRYNAAPQLVTIGAVMNADDSVVRSPMQHLQMNAGLKTEDGETEGAGDAKLLEMTGQGIEAGLKFVESQRKYALEQIDADRKDPEQMKGPMSGRAMEYLDDGYHDLVMELRGSYGEGGFVPLLKKIAQATEAYSGVNDKTDVEAIRITWPKMFQPTPNDLAQIIPALKMAIDPYGVAARLTTSSSGGSGEGGAKTSTDPQEFPQEGEQLLTLTEARSWLRDNMDIGVLDDDDDQDDEETDDIPPEPGERLPDPPAPLFDGGGEGDGGEPPPGEEGGDPLAQSIAGGVSKVTRGAPV